MNDVRAVRRQMREWRRGHATASLSAVIQDAYVAVFSAAILLSMFVSVVVQFGARASIGCTSESCAQARTMLPLVGVGAGVLLVVAVARLFGPVFAPPASISWLLSTPLDRAALLRPRYVMSLLAGGIVSAAIAASCVGLGGYRLIPTALVAGAAGLSAIAAIACSAILQPRGRWLATVVGAVVWSGLLVLALGQAPALRPPQTVAGWAWGAIALLSGLTLAAMAWSLRAVRRLRTRHLAVGGALAPGLSGALGSFDLALAYDLVLSQRWRGHHPVRPRRGKGLGLNALIYSDMVRLQRSPGRLVVALAAIVVPYALAAAGLGRAIVVLSIVVGFLALLPLLSGVRVLSRTPGLLRMFPATRAMIRLAGLTVALVVGLLVGVAAAPAFGRALSLNVEESMLAGLACGLGTVAAALRWVTGKPPDYARPMVSTPAGAVPTNLYGSIWRGFDISVLLSIPLLYSPTHGAWISIALSVIVLGVLTSAAAD